MRLPFDPAQVIQYDWAEKYDLVGVGLTMRGGDAKIIAGTQSTDEVKAFVESQIGPPPSKGKP
jgi:hypothetical protein